MRRRRATIATEAQELLPAAEVRPGSINGSDMAAAVTNGQAAPLSQAVSFIVRYQGTWWLQTQSGWITVRPAIAATLDEHAQRMRQHDAKIAAIRAIIDLVREAAGPAEPCGEPGERPDKRRRGSRGRRHQANQLAHLYTRPSTDVVVGEGRVTGGGRGWTAPEPALGGAI